MGMSTFRKRLGPVSTLTELYAGRQSGEASVLESTATSTGSNAGKSQIR